MRVGDTGGRRSDGIIGRNRSDVGRRRPEVSDELLGDPSRTFGISEELGPVPENMLRDVLVELRVRQLVAVPSLAVCSQVGVAFAFGGADEDGYVGVVLLFRDQTLFSRAVVEEGRELGSVLARCLGSERLELGLEQPESLSLQDAVLEVAVSEVETRRVLGTTEVEVQTTAKKSGAAKVG